MQVENEKEITILCKVGNFEGLKQAFETEHHLQAQICRNDKGMLRIRKTTPVGKQDNTPAIELTTKTQISDGGIRSVNEKTTPINEVTFDQLMEIADKYMDKTRYLFKMETLQVTHGEKTYDLSDLNLVFEIDVFKKADGSVSQWCKIDVEVQGIEEKLKELDVPVDEMSFKVGISKLPFEPTDFVLVDDEENADKQELIKQLFDTEFLIVNK